MYKSLLGVSVLFTLSVSANANAAIVQATAANIQTVFKNVRSGDTIVLVGNFGRTVLGGRAFTTPVRFDARRATFTDSLVLSSVTGVTITGGKFGSATAKTSYGRAIALFGTKNITVSGASFVGNKAGVGIGAQDGDRVNVTNSTFTGLKVGVVLSAVTNSSITNNRSTGAASDGFNIVNSHKVMVSGNQCTGTAPTPGAHPDCVQLWSIKGNPVQSDITVSNNTATGQTQGFNSFTPEQGGGLRIKFINNRVDTSMPAGVSCYGCVDSTISGNILTTQVGAKYKTKITISGGSNNVVANNSEGPLVRTAATPSPTGARMTSFAVVTNPADPFTDGFADDAAVGRDFTSMTSDVGKARQQIGANDVTGVQSTIPEPASWMMMIVGFGFAGTLMRTRRRLPA